MSIKFRYFQVFRLNLVFRIFSDICGYFRIGRKPNYFSKFYRTKPNSKPKPNRKPKISVRLGSARSVRTKVSRANFFSCHYLWRFILKFQLVQCSFFRSWFSLYCFWIEQLANELIKLYDLELLHQYSRLHPLIQMRRFCRTVKQINLETQLEN